jgi:hypothetical protein
MAASIHKGENPMSKDILDEFGELLMERVRDISIEELDQGVKGKAKDFIGKRVRDIVGNDPKVMEKVLQIIPVAVDTTLHYFLWMLEDEVSVKLEHKIGLKLFIDLPSGTVQNICDISDGLSGELGTSEGWVVRFSKERYDEIQLCKNI